MTLEDWLRRGLLRTHRSSRQEIAELLAISDTVEQFDRFRKKRNLSAYERSGAISDQEAEEMRSLAERLREAVGQWIQTAHPEIAPGDAKA
ncbi:MAG TPA: hypothetical protein VFH53_03390 [Phycisphaerae bacterium]|nr:hypothetical protein [Phycisphaerae bacterium]